MVHDGRTVELKFNRLPPAMQVKVAYRVGGADGAVYLTIHEK